MSCLSLNLSSLTPPNTPRMQSPKVLSELGSSPHEQGMSCPSRLVPLHSMNTQLASAHADAPTERVVDKIRRSIFQQESTSMRQTSIAPLPPQATLKKIRHYLNEWAIGSDERAQVCQKLMRFLVSSKSDLILSAKELPDIFYLEILVTRVELLWIQSYSQTQLPDSIYCLKNLQTLWVTDSSIHELSDSISNLSVLKSVTLDECNELTGISKSINDLYDLTYLKISRCASLEKLPQFSRHLRQLTTLWLPGCTRLAQVPESICNLYRLEDFNLSGCHALTELPECIAELFQLKSLDLSNMARLNVPISLYGLELESPGVIKHPGVKEAAAYMRALLRGRRRVYEVQVYENEESFDQEKHLVAEIRRDTLIPFARQHLRLSLQAIGPQNSHDTEWVPLRSLVRYMSADGRVEIGGDVGGLSREFWSQCIPNIARQLEQQHPILKDTGEGHYVLEKEMGCLMTARDIELCEDIGGLLSVFASGLGDNFKLGNLFSEHFYSALVHIYFIFFNSNSKYSECPFFQAMPDVQKNILCCLLAIANKGGVKDRKGNLLFDMYEKKMNMGEHRKVTCLDIALVNLFSFDIRNNVFTDETLYKIWRILNLQVDEGVLTGIFPLLGQFISEFEEPFLEEEELEDFLVLFKSYLATQQRNGEYIADFVAKAIVQYAYDTYSRQAEPLVHVAYGFRNVAELKIKSVVKAYRCGLSATNIASYGKMLSDMIQGQAFTREAFMQLMCRCVNQSQGAYHGAVQEKMGWIKKWYEEQATEQEMRDLVRCMNGAEDIKPDLHLYFNGPEGSLSVFHTCFATVNMGSQLLAETDKNACINLWQKNVDWALRGAGFNVL